MAPFFSQKKARGVSSPLPSVEIDIVNGSKGIPSAGGSDDLQS